VHAHHHHADRRRTEHVVLEIGGDVGALVVYTDPELLGAEVEISPARDDRRREHKEVLERSTGSTTRHALVFDRLAAGSYTLWLDGVARARGVHVDSGAVAELDWRSHR